MAMPIAAGGMVGALAEWFDEAAGTETAEGIAGFTQRMREELSPAHIRRQAEAAQESEGILGTAGAYLSRPDLLASEFVGTAPVLGAARYAAKGLGAAARAAGASEKAVRGAQVAGGEGVIAGVMTGGQVLEEGGGMEQALAASAMAAITTTGIGAAGRRAARRLGTEDVEDIILGGQRARGGVRGMATRGMLEAVEEFGQEGGEQFAQNIALGKDAFEGVTEAGTVGAMIGAGLGITTAAGDVLARPTTTPTRPSPEPEPEPVAPPVVRPREAKPVKRPEQVKAEADRALVKAIDQVQSTHKKRVMEDGDVMSDADSADMAHRIERGERMKEAVQNPEAHPELHATLEELRTDPENFVGEEARAVARYVVRQEVRNQIAGDAEATARLDAMTDADHRQLWQATDETSHPKDLRRENARYQEDALLAHVQPQAEAETTVETDTTPETETTPETAETPVETPTEPVTVETETAPAQDAADSPPADVTSPATEAAPSPGSLLDEEQATDEALAEEQQAEETAAGERHIPEASATQPSRRSQAVFGGGLKMDAHYAIVDADDVRTSHKETTGAPTEGYRGGQQREDPSFQPGGKDAAAVDLMSAQADQRLVDTPASVNEGVPTLLPTGDAVGGNKRSMAVKRIYRTDPERARRYQEDVRERAAELGLDVPASVKNPMLVRVLEDDTRFADPKFVNNLNTLSDKPATVAKDPREEAKAQAQNLDKTIRVVSKNIGGNETLGTFLASPSNVDAIVRALVDDGILTHSEAAKYVAPEGKGGGLTAAGRDLVTNLFKLRALGDSQAVEELDKYPDLRAKLDGAWHVIIGAQENTGINIGAAIRDLAHFGAVARATGLRNPRDKKTGARGSLLEMLRKQPRREGEYTIPESAVQLEKWLMNSSTPEIRDAFSGLARQSMVEMFGEPPPSLETLVEKLGVTAPWDYGQDEDVLRDQDQGGLLFGNTTAPGVQNKERKPLRKIDGDRPTPGNAVMGDGEQTTADSNAPLVDQTQLSGFDERMAFEMITALHAVLQIAAGRNLKFMRRKGWIGMARGESVGAELGSGLAVLLDPAWYNKATPQQRVTVLAHEIGHIAAALEDKLGKLRGERRSRVNRILRSLTRANRDMKKIMVGQGRDEMHNRAWLEAVTMSFAWRPMPANSTEEHMKYRLSPDEIWADFFSAVMVAPDFVRTNAPLAWSNFHDLMPLATRAAYDEAREMMSATTQELVEHDRKWQEELHERQRQTYRERTERDIETRRIGWFDPTWWREKLIDPAIIKTLGRGRVMRRKGLAAERAGRKNIADVLDRDFEPDVHMAERFNPVILKMNDNNLPEAELDDMLRNMRIAEGDPVLNEEALEQALAEMESTPLLQDKTCR